MTKLRRRVVRLALLLQMAGIEPAFRGGTYRETALGLQQQLSALTRGRRRAVGRRANRLISEAGGLEAARKLVALPLNQRNKWTQTPSDHFPKPSRNLSPKAPRCSVCPRALRIQAKLANLGNRAAGLRTTKETRVWSSTPVWLVLASI